MTGGAGVARPRAVAGEGAPRLRAAAAVLAQVGEAPAEKEGQIRESQFCRERDLPPGGGRSLLRLLNSIVCSAINGSRRRT